MTESEGNEQGDGLRYNGWRRRTYTVGGGEKYRRLDYVL